MYQRFSLALFYLLIMLFVISRLSGWRKLSKSYSGKFAGPKESFWFRSGKFNPVRYNGGLFIGLSDEGISISMLILARYQHPPLAIPWDRITRLEKGKGWFRTYSQFEVDEVKIRIYGKPGYAIFDHIQKIVNVESPNG